MLKKKTPAETRLESQLVREESRRIRDAAHTITKAVRRAQEKREQTIGVVRTSVKLA